MSLRRIGSILIVLIGFNVFLDTFFSFERGNFTIRLVPYAFKSLQLFLMLVIIFYFLSQRIIPIKIPPVFWLFFFFVGDMVASVFYAQDQVNPTDLARMIFWVLAAFAICLLRQADCLEEKVMFGMVVFNLGWVCFRILAFKVLNIWIGAQVSYDETVGFDNDGVVNNLGYSLVWLVPLFLLFKSKIRFPLLFIVLFSMVASFKRGALLGLILGSVVYYFLDRRVRGRQNRSLVKDMAMVLAVLALAGVGFLLFKDHILARMEDISGDKSFGSGREIFYQIVLNHWERFVGMKKVIGAGFFQVMPMLGLYYENAIPAHSDWLETLYDQGFIGVAMLAAIHSAIVIRILETIKKGREWGPHLAYSYVIFFLSSVYSITLYSFDTTWFGVSLGYYLGTDILFKRRAGEEPVPAKAAEKPGFSAAVAYH